MGLNPVRQWLYLALEEHKGNAWARLINRFLMLLVAVNVVVVAVESEHSIYVAYEPFFWWFEVFSVAVFTLEYVVRAWICVESSQADFQHPLEGRGRYLLSPKALVDLIAILPFYLSFFWAWRICASCAVCVCCVC